MPDIFDSLLELKLLPRQLDNHAKSITATNPDDYFESIKKLIDRLDKPTTPQPPPRSEYYLKQWKQLLEGKITALDRSAVKYLCWEHELLEDSRFCAYLIQNMNIATARVIKGLLRSIHLSWSKDSPGKEIVFFTAKQIKLHLGRDRTLAKWKSDTNMLLGKGGPALFAKNVLVGSLIETKIAAELWALSEHSAYMRYAVVNAVEQCLAYIGRNKNYEKYVLETLMLWNGWDSNRSGFDFIVKELILHDNVNAIIERLRNAILIHKLLGDPRLPANRNKWLGVDSQARQRFIGWLAKRDIVFFFDNVLQGNDPHGRREFWLRYVNAMIASRPLLSENAAYPFRGNKDVSFGKLSSSTNRAAFILHFGDVVAIEFSDVGKVYIYKRNEFESRVKDMWTNAHIREDRLKNQGLPDERMIRHVNWQYKIQNILAREGIRP
jgi:hypothetical protein